MKQLYFLLLLFFAVPAFSQDVKMPRNDLREIEYSEVVITDSLVSTQLFFNSQAFVNAVFGDQNNLPMQNEKEKAVAVKASLPIMLEISNDESIPLTAVFTLIIQSNDKSYQYTFKDFYAAFTDQNRITINTSYNDHIGIGFTGKQWNAIEKQTDKAVRQLIGSLKLAMAQNSLMGTQYIKSDKKKKN